MVVPWRILRDPRTKTYQVEQSLSTSRRADIDRLKIFQWSATLIFPSITRSTDCFCFQKFETNFFIGSWWPVSLTVTSFLRPQASRLDSCRLRLLGSRIRPKVGEHLLFEAIRSIADESFPMYR